MSFLRKLKSSKHFLKKGDTFLNNIEETTYFDLNQRDLIVYHIDSETEGTFSLTVKNDDTGDLVLDRVCDHYNLHDYKEYFGLKYTLVDDSGDHEILWLDPMKYVGKQLKETNNVLTFRVKHFPGKPQNIESEYVRYLIFLQIRNYLLKGDLQLALAEDIKLAAFAVQASVGDYDKDILGENYLAEVKFLSRKSFKAEEKITELHKQLRGKTPAEMELAFLEKASQFDTYGAELIVVKTSKGVPINFGVSHNGIITYLHGTPANIAKIDMFPWSQIGKISYEGRTLRVHFHTPDQTNFEIIKKQVMVFRCNNSRICKHLWKFILDQKAFFNFKRGVDVPRIKSSSRLFTLKSKFRFSGRCEREIISSQPNHNESLCSVESSQTLSPYETSNASTNFNSLNRSGLSDHSSSTVVDHNFKRRTFMQTPRSFVRPKNTEKQISYTRNDSNNNVVVSNNSQGYEKQSILFSNNNDDINKKYTNQTNNAQLESVVEKNDLENQIPSEKDIKTVQNSNKDNKNNGLYVNTPAQATSTPSLPHKTTNVESVDKRISDITVFNNNNNDLNKTSNSIKSVDSKYQIRKTSTSDEESDDEFFEHDYLQKQQSKDDQYSQKSSQKSKKLDPIQQEESLDHDNSITNLSKNNNSPNFLNMSTNKPKKYKNLACNFIIIVSILFIFFFFLILIEHWKCTLSSSSSITQKLKRPPNCNYQKTLAKLSNNLQIGFQTILSRIFSTEVTMFSWPLQANSSSILDPIFSWFNDQYQES